MNRTIAAISTASENAGIGIVRISGENAFDIIKRIFVPKNNNFDIKGYTLKYGNIVDENKNVVDEVLVSFFVGPKSYTRQNMCEINTHGGMIVERKILELCLKNGCEMAEPGEFTKLAFLNGRINLSQAEAIIDLINSKSDIEAKESINQLKGKVSKKIEKIEKDLMNLMISLEVTIDYPEYDIEEVKKLDTMQSLKDIEKELFNLEDSFNTGKIIKDGIKTVIIGRPNSGKSSLLNAILDEDRAIVSDIEGTTRDTIEEFVNINGFILKLIDTAGIRESENEIEKIGVEKSKKLAEDCDLIIAIFDITSELNETDKEILNIINNKNAIIVLNKKDIKHENPKLESFISKIGKPIVKISAKENEGIEDLYKEIEMLFKLDKIKTDNKVLITNERHKNQIRKAKENVKEAQNIISQNLPTDICSIYIKQALEDLGEITGKNTSENIIDEIFKNFCLGK